MNGRRVTDAQIATALRAHLPEVAAPGLRERVFDAAEATAQLRSFPSFLGALTEADPVSRRRSLLIAAALLLALAVASAAAVGAWRLLQRDPIDELSLEPPDDVPAFVLSSYERLPQLPPLALTWRDGSEKGRVYVDQSGAVRFDRFTSADAEEPASYTILSPNNRISGMAHVGPETVWVEQGDEAFGHDAQGNVEVPRVFLRTVLSGRGGGPGCEMERDPSGAGNGTAAAGWRYVGLEYVAGRPTHHVACVGELSLDVDLWLDIETRLILRAREPLTDDAGQPIPGQFEYTEVTEIAFGEQPAALFEPPDGVTRMSAGAYDAYLCGRDLPDEERVGLSGVRESCSTPPEAEATPLPAPTPMPTPGPGPTDCAVVSGDPTERTGPLAWSQASLQEDWPAPVRPEPAGGGIVQPMPLTHLDPTGDTGPDVLPCVDIRAVIADTSSVRLKLVSSEPPVVDPAEQWIAYGVVIDDDRDGVPDWRYGIDNMPAAQSDDVPHWLNYLERGRSARGWRTNLHTGQTDASAEENEPVCCNGGGFKGGYPSGLDASFRFGGVSETTQGSASWGIELDMPFYTWASVIVNGRVVATDYAPDSGWLVATRGAKPGGTYLLEDHFPLHLSMTLPDGWMGVGAALGGGAAVTRDEEIGVEFMIIDQPANCVDASGNAIDLQIGRSVDDLVTFVAGHPTIQRMTKISENRDVTLDGYRGRYLEYTNTFVDDGNNCDGPVWPLMHEFNQAWILDVGGVRLVIDAFSSSEDDETVRAELRRIVESIHFER